MCDVTAPTTVVVRRYIAGLITTLRVIVVWLAPLIIFRLTAMLCTAVRSKQISRGPMSSKKSHVFLHASLRLQRGLLGVLGHHIIILDMIHSVNFIISLPSGSTTSQIVHRTIKLLG